MDSSGSTTLRSRLALALLAVLLATGIAMAVRLVHHHEVQIYGDATDAFTNCPQTETISCEAVNTSAWSELLGVPIAAFAVPTYLLVLGLVLLGMHRDALLGYAFCIGLLGTLYSGFLFWVSSTQIGYLCLWCMGLYGINLAIPILVGIAAWRSPFALVRGTLRDLAAWPGSLRFTTAAFVVLLAGTIVAQRIYRHEIRLAAADARARIEEQGGPLLPAVPPGSETVPPGSEAAPAPDRKNSDSPGDPPQSAVQPPGPSSHLWPPGSPWPPRMEGGPGPMVLAAMLRFPASLAAAAGGAATPSAAAPPAHAPAAAAQTGGVYRLAGPLRRLSGSSQKLLTQPFDLQGRLGHGKPVALLFWAPDYRESERELVTLATFLALQTPQFEVYAVAGRRDDQQDEEIWERFSMLDVPPSLPLLIDDQFVVSQALTTLDVPDLAVFDGKGALVVAKIKDLSQALLASTGRVTAEALLRKVASGAAVEQIKSMFPFYPSADLIGRCAPPFSARKFDSTETYNFTGRSPSGKPTLVMFWSSTCKHCQKEIPQMVEWMKKYPGVVDVVSVTHIKKVDGSDATHRKITANYIREQHIPWLVLEDPDNAIAELYGSDSTPTTYFVSPASGIVDIWYYAHEGNFRAAIEATLAKAHVTTACAPPPAAPAARLGFSVLAPDGKRVPLASLLDRPALVHFWATWCAPCVAELPSLLKYRDRIEKAGAARVVLVSVEGEDAGPRIAAFGKKLGLDLRSYWAPSGGLAEKIDLGHRVPRTYLVAPGGDVLALRQGSQPWDDPDLEMRVRSRLEVLGNGTAAGPVKPAKATAGAR